jgi:hypothetical protein
VSDEAPGREELKTEVERLGREAGHTLGPWLDLPHAGQIGCLACDRYAFVQVLPPPPKLHVQQWELPCPSK